MAERTTSVLFVCTGNICRSPTAEGVFRHMARSRGVAGRILIDSAGIIDFHAGEPPDPRAVEHAARRGYDLSDLRARQLTLADYHNFDRILAMDRTHLRELKGEAPKGTLGRIARFLDYSEAWRGQDVPDPYYGEARGFEEVLDMVEEASSRLLEAIVAEISR
ncbi:MAG: low molecular weight phosphotyrosine protein phosphatase [Betaproteobacteria bacterium]|nr:low molecular weight phosphotyrosine protein phosphatase [Betaproteobacteria bacterium]